MLVVTPISAGVTDYFTDGRDPGRWSGDGARALGLDGAVAAGSLRRVLGARHPRTGQPLGTRLRAHRRAGWDLTFAAPKSVSLLAALASPDHAALMAASHTGAVTDALGWIVARSCRARRDGHLCEASVVVARFEHSASDDDDPHLHSHAVLANLAFTPDGRWSALAGSPLWTSLRSLGDIYRLALRAHLARVGFQLTWRQAAGPPGGRSDGLVEVAGVPVAAVRAVSRRGSEVAQVLSGWDDPGVASRATRRAVRGSTRSGHASATFPAGAGEPPVSAEPPRTGAGEPPVSAEPPKTGAGGPPVSAESPMAGTGDRPPGVPAPWAERLEATGWGRAAAAELLASVTSPALLAHAGAPPPSAGDSAAMARWLCERGSTFTAMDVVRAIGATSQVGLRPAEVEAVVAGFCGDPEPFARPIRWTTPQAARIDASLLQRVAGGWGVAIGERRAVVGESTVAAVAAAHLLNVRAADDVRRIAAGPQQVQVLAGQAGASALIEQATILAAAAAAWRSEGFRLEVLAPDPALRRWDALAGVGAGRRSARPDVLIVDRADRMSSVALRAVLETSGSQTKVVLVDGGTLPARHHPLSGAFAEMIEAAGGRQPRALGHIGASPDQVPDEERVVTLGAISVGRGPRDALGALVGRWAAHPPGERPVLVGFGPAEVEALNAASRHRRIVQGELSGPAVTSGGRDYQVGDAVMVLRRLRVAAGTAGTVTEVDRAAGVLTVDWGAKTTTVDRHEAVRIGHGYAVTPARVQPGVGAVLVLGDPRRVSRLQPRIAGVALVAAGPTIAGRGRMDAAIAAALAPARTQPQAMHAPPGGDEHLPLDAQDQRSRHGARGEMRGRLVASMPPDPQVVARLAEEDKSWGRSGSRPAVDGAGGTPDPKLAQEAWRTWVEAHAAELVAFHRYDEAAQFQEAAIDRAREIDPGRRWIGPPALDLGRNTTSGEMAWGRNATPGEMARGDDATPGGMTLGHDDVARTAGIRAGPDLGVR